MSKSEDNFGVQGSQQHTPAEVDEHAIISSVHGKKVFVVDSAGNQIDGATEAKQDNVITELTKLNSLVPAVYDYIALSYTGVDLTGVVFKTGGVGGTTVSTLTLAYTGSVLDSVTKT